MRFTALVVCWNNEGEIAELARSVEEHLGDSCELLFVDNASTDGTVAAIREHASAARLIELPANVGFGPANNLGVREAETEVVVLLNPDTVMIDGSLADLAELAAAERALFSPRMLNEDRSVQISARPALASWESALISVLPGALMPGPVRRRCEPWRYEERLPAGWLTGACIAARRDLLLELGPFDERLVMYGEDADMGMRAWRKGIPSWTAPDVSRIVHIGGRSASQAYSDNGMRRKIVVRWWIIREHLGAARAWLDFGMELLRFGSRWAVRSLLRRDASNEASWLRGARAMLRGSDRELPQLPTGGG